jgi:hypothetical protein
MQPGSLHRRVLLYRESARHLWNTCFAPRANATDAGQLLDAFERIAQELFTSMTGHVLRNPGDTRPVPARIEVHVHAEAEVMVSREPGSMGSWDHPVTAAGSGGLRAAFLGFFDWDELGPRDFAYCRLDIAGFPAHPELVGHHCLVHVRDAAFG